MREVSVWFFMYVLCYTLIGAVPMEKVAFVKAMVVSMNAMVDFFMGKASEYPMLIG